MSAVSSEGGQDFDLNIAPIIDCFTVLIAYLLVSASFLSLGVFDVGVAASGDQVTPAEAPKEPPMSMAIELKENHEFIVKITGGVQNLNLNIPIMPKANTASDIEALTAKMKEVKQNWPKIEDTSLSGEPGVRYKELIKTIEAIQPTFPKVFIAG